MIANGAIFNNNVRGERQNTAVASHQAGRLFEAVAMCQAVLTSSRHADCLHIYGVVEARLGHAGAASKL